MIEFFSYAKLSALREALLENGAGDSEGVIYMLPSKSNEGMLLDMLRREGNYFGARPLVWSWQDLYNAVVPKASRRRCVDPPDHNLILKFVLEQTLNELDSMETPVPAGVRKRGFIRLLGESIKEMLLEGVAPDLMLDQGDGGVAAGRELLFRLYTDYLLYLEEAGLADNAQLPSLAAEELVSELPAHLKGRVMRWVGFMSFTGAQLKLVSALKGLGTDMELYMPDSGGVNFRDAASQLGATPTRVPSAACSVRPMASPDIYSQFEMIADEIALNFPSLDVGMLVPPEHIRLAASALAKRGTPWQARSEVTVDKTALMDAAERAWEAHKLGWPPIRTMHLLRAEPFSLDLDEGIAREMPEGMGMWKKSLPSGDGAAALSRLDAFCSIVGADGGCDCEALLRGLLAFSGDGDWEERLAGEADEAPDMDSAVREIASSRLEIEHKLAMMEDVTPAIGAASSVRFSGDDAMGFLKSWAAEAAIALPPRHDGAVCLYDSPPPALASHQIWIMADVEGTRYPGPASDHSLLAEDFRESVNSSAAGAHLPTLHEKRSQKEALFRRLLAVGEIAAITVRPMSDSSGNPLRDSPFMSPDLYSGSAWVLAGASERAPKPAGYRNAADRGPFPRFAVRRASGAKTRISISMLDKISSCPFSYWCETEPELDRKTPRGELFGPKERGTVMHEVWKTVWDMRPPDADCPTLRAALACAWDGAMASLSSKYPLVSDPRSKPALADMKTKMLRIADAEDDFERNARSAGIQRVRTFTELDLPNIELEHAIFAGRADRVDFMSSPHGTFAVISDYKTKGASRYRESLQLAAYAAALRNSDVAAGGVRYLCHG
ncbi:MAG: PD-(D/E)XK nuclease family protein, partial [Synergistaceae bacterium]|nr:PD-(D/E)XK nuclease family protein [Synergistaceae bacterium]